MGYNRRVWRLILAKGQRDGSTGIGLCSLCQQMAREHACKHCMGLE
jgi:hypothetical protein